MQMIEYKLYREQHYSGLVLKITKPRELASIVILVLRIQRQEDWGP